MSWQNKKNNNHRGSLMPLIAGIASMIGLAIPAVGVAGQLTELNLFQQGDNAEVVTMKFSGRAPRPSIFTSDAPARLTIDFRGVDGALADVDRKPPRGLIRSVDSGSVSDGLRLALKLEESVPFHVERGDNKLKLFLNTRPNQSSENNGVAVTRLERDPSDERTEAVSSGSKEGPTSVAAYDADQPAGDRRDSAVDDDERRVTHINFRRGDNDAGYIVLKLSASNAPVSVKREGGQVIAIVADTDLPSRLRKQLDVRDFGTIVNRIDVDQRQDKVQLKITPRKGTNYTQLAYATGQTVKIELKPKETAADTDSAEKRQFKGKKISLSFQDIEVRKLLQIIASVADVNLVMSGQVTGKTSLRLENVSWDQALHIILRAQGLGQRENEDVITVAPLSQMAARDKAENAADQATENLKTLQSEIIPLNYAEAGDVQKLIEARKGDESSLLSERGQIRVDERTNSLITNATRQHIDAIRKLIKQLDQAQKQVLVQARIVVANRDFSRQMGTTFNANGVEEDSGSGPQGGGQIKSGGFSVGLPSSSQAGQLATSIITGNVNVSLTLDAMQTENRGKIISAPRLITANGQKATVSRGTQIPYLSSTSSSNTGTSVRFKDAELSLGVTPRITPDKHVLLDLNIKKDSLGENVSTAEGNAEPAIDTNQLKTKVLVDNGNTLVLGGIYKHTNTRQKSEVPFFSKIPLLGRLFTRTNRNNQRRQLLIFITPRILSAQVREAAGN